MTDTDQKMSLDDVRRLMKEGRHGEVEKARREGRLAHLPAEQKANKDEAKADRIAALKNCLTCGHHNKES